MARQGLALIAVAGTLLAGCVSQDKYLEAVGGREAARRAAAEAAAALDAAQKEAQIKLGALEQEKTRLASELIAAQGASVKAARELDSVKAALETERQARQDIQGKLDKLRSETDEGQRVGTEIRRERDLFKTKADDLQRRLDTAQQELGSATKALTDARTRITALEKEKEQAVAALTQAKNQARDLETKLAAEQVKLSTLREEKQKLMSGTTTAQEEVAKLQKRAGELETEAARAADLHKRLEERDQEIAKLRQTVADRQTLLNKVNALTDELDKTKERVTALTAELKVLSEDAARVKRERDDLLAGAETLRTSLHRQEELLRSREEEKARVEAERAVKEEETKRLAQTSAALAKALEAEIASGDVRLRQAQGRLTIIVTDRSLFESRQGEVKPAGGKLLSQVSEILKNAHGRWIVVEGHTDNVPIGAKLREKYPSNWELSMARAASVVRYLSEQGGLDPSRLSAVGYADTRPLAGNDTDEGRAANRRIEIVLAPRNPAENAGGPK